MKRVALLGDTHFGIKNGHTPIHENMWRFFDNIFFPTLEKEGIDTVLHMGDVFHDRTNIRFPVLHEVRNRFLNVLRDKDIAMHVSIGNHDTHYKSSSEINSPELILSDYDNIHVYTHAQDIEIDGVSYAVLPWINRSNRDESLQFLSKSKSMVLFGHLEVSGFLMNVGIKCKTGLDHNLFENYDRVFSGHFHKQSNKSNIHYIGSPFQFDFGDVNETKGFHLFDPETRDTEFVENPFKNFHRLVYDDKTNEYDFDQDDFTIYQDAFVKVVVTECDSDKTLEALVELLYDVNATVRIEDTRHIDEVEIDNTEDISSKKTIDVIYDVIQDSELSVEKEDLKKLMSEIYTEAVNT